MDVALTLALFQRLTGYPLDSQGNPLLNTDGSPRNRNGSYGIRIPAPLMTVSQGAPSTQTPDAVRLWGRGYHQNSYIQVPVWFGGTDFKKHDQVWPCVSFVESDLIPGGDPYLYDDPIVYGEGSATVGNEDTGYTETGPDVLHSRKHPEPWTIQYTIRLYSKDPVEIQWLERALIICLGQKGALTVEQADGTFRTVDYRCARVAFFDQGEMFNPESSEGSNRDSYLTRAFTFVCEANVDNTVQGFGTLDWSQEQTVLHRILELSDLQERIWEGRQELNNLLP